MKAASFFLASAVATLAAGPIACLSYFWLLLATGDPALLKMPDTGPGDFVFIGGRVWLFVSIAAAVPIAIGTAAMGLLGRAVCWARSRMAWGLAGLILAGLPAAALAALIGGETALGFAVAGTATGTGCALISRHFIRWAEPAPQA